MSLQVYVYLDPPWLGAHSPHSGGDRSARAVAQVSRRRACRMVLFLTTCLKYYASNIMATNLCRTTDRLGGESFVYYILIGAYLLVRLAPCTFLAEINHSCYCVSGIHKLANCFRCSVELPPVLALVCQSGDIRVDDGRKSVRCANDALHVSVSN